MPIQPVTTNQLAVLQAISRETFSATFGADNSPTDLNDYLDQAYSTTQLTAELEQPDSFFYFIYHHNDIAGYLKLNINKAQTEGAATDTLEIERIYIRGPFKRLGLGTQLINHALTIAAQNHKTKVWLGVWEHNTAALHFYTNLGFKQIGEHVFQLGTDAQRDLIMQKTLR
ncbi:GNAT family N-acetyltransferase [Latilactobacillus graminis]|nr:GNAT family N-acetyltransferase [Latilactobacillus graminis]QFP80356.1 GNAT family N-acetyltransferase [Latilactobacillus graminis]